MTENTLPTGERQKWFDSTRELYDEACKRGTLFNSDSWAGGMSQQKMQVKIYHGDEKHVPAAEKILADVMEGIDFASIKSEWIFDQAGAFPDVPVFLSGSPDHMRRRVQTSANTAPMKIYVCTTSSAGVNNGSLERRGIALLALTLALSRARPVELWTFTCHNSGTTILTRLPTQPPDLGSICFALVETAFTRNLLYSYDKSVHRWNGNWHKYGYDLAACRKLLCAADEDYVFPPIHLDQDFANPVKWVKEKLREILNLSAETTL